MNEKKNRANIFRWEIWGILFVLVVGASLHFSFEWSGEFGVVGAFSAVNESVWLTIGIVLFGVFTFFPPEAGIFRDPETGGFGIK